MKPKYSQLTKLKQSQVMHFALQRALHVLQMPVDELAQWLSNEVEQNPLLDLIPSRHVPSSHHQPAQTEHPLDHLKREIAIHFSDHEEKEMALEILNQLDQDGFVSLPDQEMQEVCQRIARLDPPGIAASSLQESLLIQLECLGKTGQLIEDIVANHWDAFLQGQLSRIAKCKKISIAELKSYLQTEVPLLNFHPGRGPEAKVRCASPDIIISEHQNVLTVHLAKDILPAFEMNKSYLELMETEQLRADDQAFVRRQCAAGKWLTRMVERRHNTLQRLGEYLLEQQRGFFENRTSLQALTIKDTAQELGLSISTINRAIKDKTLLAPQGVFELRTFFSAHNTPTICEVLKELIHNEDTTKPLSDADLVKALANKNITCARRTVTKYRQKLKIPSAAHRKVTKEN